MPTAGQSLDSVVELAYHELRALAARFLQGEDDGHTLQPTALVHEAVLRLMEQPDVRYHDRQHLIALCAQAMRRVLVDHARRRRATKRDAGTRIELDAVSLPALARSEEDVIGVDEALTRFALLDPRAARVVELRYFAGFSIEETAELLGVSLATVKRDWLLARAWLQRELEPPQG